MALTIQNVTFGQGRPKICVPLMGRHRMELEQEMTQLTALPASLVEWRADQYVGDRKSMLPLLREWTRGRLLLVTLRTLQEGGASSEDPEACAAFCLEAAASGYVDLIDVELRWGTELVRDLISRLRSLGVAVVLSSHDWEGTPESGVLLDRFQQMSELGASLRKIAVTPHVPEDVLRLLRVTRKAAQSDPDHPVISMAMGALGTVTRLCGEAFGSAVTFGSGQRASAPGQIPADLLEQILEFMKLEPMA